MDREGLRAGSIDTDTQGTGRQEGWGLYITGRNVFNFIETTGSDGFEKDHAKKKVGPPTAIVMKFALAQVVFRRSGRVVYPKFGGTENDA
jgi:hypothetical protein